MIQVAAAFPGRPANGATRAWIEFGSAGPLADILTSRSTAARIVDHDWNRNSQAMRLKSSTL
jgi:predicted nicotinamide N-methyase